MLHNYIFRISNRQLPHLSREKGFELITPDPEEIPHLPSIACRGANWLPHVSKRSDVVRLRRQPAYYARGINETKQNLYLSLLRNGLNRFGLQNPRNSQFIAFKRIECGFVNEICVPVYNHHTIFDFEKNVTQIFIGDKIMVSKNSDVPVYAIPKENSTNQNEDPGESENDYKGEFETKQLRLMNGSVYMIEDIREARSKEDQNKNGSNTDQNTIQNNESASQNNETMQNKEGVVKKVRFFVLDDLADEFVRPNCKAFGKLCKPCHAYALTIHKFQGSEADTIVYGVSDSKMETWKHVYTAVTRGKKRVVIVGTWENLVNAVRRNARQRQTTLQEKMCKVLTKLRKGEELDIDEEDNDQEKCNQQANVQEPIISEENHTSIVERRDQLPCFNSVIMSTASKKVQENKSPRLQRNREVKKDSKRNIAGSNDKDDLRECKAQKIKSDIFPDDSFNNIASQIPESELNGAIAGSSNFSSPACVRLRNSMNHQPRILCSTPKESMSHNDSSFETQMSQMNDSQFKNFMNNL